MNIASFYKKTVRTLKKSDIKSAEIDARILLELATGESREFLLAHPEFELSDKEYHTRLISVDRRKSVEPIAYITGKKEFFGLEFLVTPDVLIPRPETEMLVEQALKFIKSKVRKVESSLKILDVGTGSGNIIISIANHWGNLLSIDNKLPQFTPEFVASDISGKALKVARKNAKKHGVEKLVKFVQSDLFDRIDGRFNIMVANLPYVPKQKTDDGKRMTEEINFEPRNAIFANDNGTMIIKKFLSGAKNRINGDGLILVEVDPRNARELKNYAGKLYKSVVLKKDFSGIYRVLKILT